MLVEFVAAVGDPGPFRPYQILCNGAVVGQAGFHAPPDEQGRVTVGYEVVPAVRGWGCATAALHALLEIAAAAGLCEVRAEVAAGNSASRRVVERCGFALHESRDGRCHYVHHPALPTR